MTTKNKSTNKHAIRVHTTTEDLAALNRALLDMGYGPMSASEMLRTAAEIVSKKGKGAR